MKEDNNDKIKSVVKLGLWLIFIAVLVIVAKFGGKDTTNNVQNNNQTEIKEEQNKEEVIISYEEKLNKLVNNYKYTYEIKIGDNIYSYEGSKMEKNSAINESGRLSLNGEIKYNYFLENGYIYQVNNGGLDKVESIYDIGIDSNYLDVLKIKEMILDKEYVVSENKYSYELEDKKIDIYTDENNINKIEIFIEEDYYKLNLESIGEIKEISY